MRLARGSGWLDCQKTLFEANSTPPGHWLNLLFLIKCNRAGIRTYVNMTCSDILAPNIQPPAFVTPVLSRPNLNRSCCSSSPLRKHYILVSLPSVDWKKGSKGTNGIDHIPIYGCIGAFRWWWRRESWWGWRLFRCFGRICWRILRLLRF
jgi:hypothetical protein